MSYRVKDGITIKIKINNIDNERERYPLYLMLIQLLAVFIGNWSLISILIETFNIPVSIASINLFSIPVCLALYLIFRWKSYDMWKIISLILIYLFYLFCVWEQLKNGFYILENLVINKINIYYEINLMKYVADYRHMQEDTALVVISIMIPLAVVLTISMVRGWMLNLCVVIMIIPVAASFGVGVVPSEINLIALVIVMLFMLKIQGTKLHDMEKAERLNAERVNGNVATLLCAISLGLMLIIRLLFAPEDYINMSYIPDRKQELQTFLSELSFEDLSNQFSEFKVFPETNASYGGLSGGQLGKIGEVKYTGDEHLQITIPRESLSKGMYLKGYVGIDYTGDSWDGPSREVKEQYEDLLQQIQSQEFQPINQTPSLLNRISVFSYTSPSEGRNLSDEQYSFKKGSVFIEYVKANKDYIYAPYYTDFNEREDMEYRGDLYAKPIRRKNNYEISYYYDISMEDGYGNGLHPNLYLWDGKYLEYEKLYQDYVYDVYTKLPEQGLRRLKSDFSMTVDQDDNASLQKQIQYVKYYLHNNTSYTLSPGELPKGEDFVEYFLYENNRGYCAHYASAATLMLRAMNIPARYVEGYAISNIPERNSAGMQDVTVFPHQNVTESKVEFGEYVVSDFNAHAWVEVYINGIGWIPIEFTPSAAVVGTMETMEDLLLLQEDIDNGSRQQHLTITPTPTNMPEITDIIEPTDLPSDTNQIDKEVMNQRNGKKAYLFILLKLFGVSLLIGIAFLQYRMLARKKKIKNLSGNYSRKALYIYGEIEKLLTLLKVVPRDNGSLEDAALEVETHCEYIVEGTLSSCIKTVRKARYGREEICLEELQQVEGFHSELYNRINRTLTTGRRIYLKIALLI